MAFNDETIDRVWQKARSMTEPTSELWRRDECGAWIRRDHYGSEHSEFAWKIENVSPGGPDVLENLRPFHRANGFDRATGHARCRVTADQTGVPVMEHIQEPRNRAA
jgi:hypothetical protein